MLIATIVLLVFESAIADTGPIVQTTNGKIRGESMKTYRYNNFYAFRGIPYAEPPVGALRFQPPQPAKNWNGVLDSQSSLKICIQFINSEVSADENEDCLYLNVYTPQLPNEHNNVSLPVLVFIHGGAFIFGDNRIEIIRPYALMDTDIVMVTLQYRLGFLGFISTGDLECPGNNGFKDQQFALRWVQENIHNFGGDPTKVTISGQSAGAASIGYQLLGSNAEDVAKNVILFLGDGMSATTVTAARIYEGGESNLLSFEKFPYTAISKTYCVDRQVSESSSTATAYLCGTKANFFTSGVTAAVKLNDCEASILPKNQVSSIAAWSQMADKWTGFITNTRLTHASPSALYAHVAHKDWESDADVVQGKQDPHRCSDIARQLIHSEVGQNFHVILGCGRNKFLPKEINDEEGMPGHRLDKKNLIEEWKAIKEKDRKTHEYIWNREQLMHVNNDTDYLLGLFKDDICRFHVDRDPKIDPTLEEMTEVAIRKLSKSPKGYFLFVEGGLIDQAHHRSLAGKALVETTELSKAVRKAVDITNEKDTLIIVTADHAHTMSFGGYPKRGANVLGLTDLYEVFPNNVMLPILSYANGPGYRPEINGSPHDYRADVMDFNYKYPGLFKTTGETHGGDDVLIYAKGPWAHLFEGVMEQNAIPHLMAYASCVGNKSTACKDDPNLNGSGSLVSKSSNLIFYINLVLGIFYLRDILQ